MLSCNARRADAADQLYNNGGYVPATNVTSNPQRRAETFVVAFASAVNTARANVIAQGGSGAFINPAGGLIQGGPTNAGCQRPGVTCRNAFTAQNTQQLIDVLNHPAAPTTILRVRARDAPRPLVVKSWNGPAPQMLNEWAALTFLADLPGVDAIAPKPLAMDADAGVVVMTDVGADAIAAGEVLWSDDTAAAERTLLELVRTTGRLHAAAGAADHDRFVRDRARLGPTGASRHAVHRIDTNLARLPKAMRQVGFEPTPAAVRDMERVRRTPRAPAEFATLTHGDATLANALVTSSEVRLIDWETAGIRHALVDGVFGPLRYLHSVWARGLPSGLRRRLLSTYRSELVVGCEAAKDDDAFAAAAVAACAGWLACLCSRLPELAAHDVRLGRSTWRQRIVTGLEHFAEVAGDASELDALADAAAMLAAQLRHWWPAGACAIDGYPALS